MSDNDAEEICYSDPGQELRSIPTVVGSCWKNCIVYGLMTILLPFAAWILESKWVPEKYKRLRMDRKVTGRHNIPRSGPMIILVGSHDSLTGPWTVVHGLRIGMRVVHWVAGYKLYRVETAITIFGSSIPYEKRQRLARITVFIMKYGFTIPICRGLEDGASPKECLAVNKEMTRAVKDVLSRRRGIVGLFYATGIGKPVQELSPNFIRAAQRANAAIVPIILDDRGGGTMDIKEPICNGSIKEIQKKINDLFTT